MIDMYHCITQLWFGFEHQINITEDECNALQEARTRALLLSSFEDKFMLVLENFEELEQEIIHLPLHQMIYSDYATPLFIDNLRLLNRRFANLMTTCRLYKDQTAHDVSTIFGKESQQFADYERLHSQYYDQELGYRTMEAVRNFLQHRSLVLSGTSHEAKRIQEEGLVAHTGKVNLKPQSLREEGGFKQKILSELDSIADKDGNVDIRPLVRGYISALGKIHLELRKMFEGDAAKYDALILDAIQRINQLSGEEHDSAYIATYNDRGNVSSHFVLLKDFVERRRRIVNRTQHITHYATNYVSSRYNVPQNSDKKSCSSKVHHSLCVNSTLRHSKPNSCARC